MATGGRPRTFETEAALDSVLELFWKNGYRVTTTRELETTLGLNASSIYNAFGSKEELLAAAMDRYARRITSTLLEPLETSDEGLSSLEAFFDALAHWITHEGRRGCMLVNMMAEDGGESPTVARRVRRYRTRLRGAFRCALERAERRGEVSGADVDARADLLMCQVFGLNIAARGGAGVAELRRLATSVQRQIQEWTEGR